MHNSFNRSNWFDSVMKVLRLQRFLSSLLGFALVLLLIVPSAIAAVSAEASVEPSGEQVETPLERSVRLNAFLNGGEDRRSTLQDPVIDPNFNVMRKNDTANGKALFYVFGLLVIASVVPIVTWIALRQK